jgi:hypothetical protein
MVSMVDPQVQSAAREGESRGGAGHQMIILRK